MSRDVKKMSWGLGGHWRWLRTVLCNDIGLGMLS